MDGVKCKSVPGARSVQPCDSGDGKSADWVECCYEVKIDDVMDRLDQDLVESDAHIYSEPFGAGRLLWQLELLREDLATTAGDNSGAANDFQVGAFLHLSPEFELAEAVKCQFKMDFKDFVNSTSPLLPFKAFGFKSSVTSFEGKTKGWGYSKVATKSHIRDKCLNSAGALVLRVTITVKNDHHLAYDLAAYVHSTRMASLVAHNKPVKMNKHALIEIRVSNTFAADVCVGGSGLIAEANENGGVDDADPISSTSHNFKTLFIWESMLVHASPVFKAMFSDETHSTESETGIVCIKDFPYDVVELFVHYIERGPAIVTVAAESESLTKLVKMADKYQVKDLFNLCVARMLKTIRLENVADYYAVSHLLDILDVKKACIAALKKKWSAKAAEGEFWNSAFGRYGTKVMADAFADYVKLG